MASSSFGALNLGLLKRQLPMPMQMSMKTQACRRLAQSVQRPVASLTKASRPTLALSSRAFFSNGRPNANQQDRPASASIQVQTQILSSVGLLRTLQHRIPSRVSPSWPQARRWDSTASPAFKQYHYEDIVKLSRKPETKRLLIDVRRPSELQETGHIPTARNVDITGNPDAFNLPPEDFEERFGFTLPDVEDPTAKTQTELIFYCKAGVRSKVAAGLARQAGWEKAAEYEGSWSDWAANGGQVERS